MKLQSWCLPHTLVLQNRYAVDVNLYDRVSARFEALAEQGRYFQRQFYTKPSISAIHLFLQDVSDVHPFFSNATVVLLWILWHIT